MAKKKKKERATARQHKIHFYRQIAFTFIGAAIVVLVGLIYFSLSQALIIVAPALEDVQADFNLLVKADAEATEEGIEAKLIYSEVEVDRTAGGELLEEGDPQQATGTITVINTSNRAQPLVATTRFLSEEGVLFRLEDGITVPANGEIDAAVYADEPGKEGEIGPSRFTIPGLNQARQQEVYGESKEAMTGGTKAIYRITQEAVDRAVEEAKDKMIAQVKEDLAAEGIEEDNLLPSAIFVKVAEQSVEPEIGTDAQEFTVTTKGTVAFIRATEQDLLKLAQAQLYANTSLGHELSTSNDGSFDYEIVKFDLDNETAQIRVRLEGQRRISSDHPSLDPANFVGKKPRMVRQELEAEPGIESVEVRLRPFWLRSIPRLVDHIYVQFEN